MSRERWMGVVFVATALSALRCGDSTTLVHREPISQVVVPIDAGVGADASVIDDAGELTDAGEDVDAGEDIDAGDVLDAGVDIDAGDVVDAGEDIDAGDVFDAGDMPDAGEVVDAGPVDAGLPVDVPPLTDWTFYGPANGGPNEVYGASYDEGGNLWVAGGLEGLYVLRAGETMYQRFTMADGLRPYGYMFDGTEPPGDKYLKVISVSGGPAGVAFVGYAGKPDANGNELACEGNWDGPAPDPSIYKSGDADRVTLTVSGISVVHYDISSGLGIAGGELGGREKICNVLRIRYDRRARMVWFSGNHGIAMGNAEYQGTGKCQWYPTNNPTPPTGKTSPFSNEPGHYGCSGVLEHAHPAVNGYKADGVTCCALLSGGYYGVTIDPVTNDPWFAGQMRTTRFKYASTGNDFYAAQSRTEDAPYISNRVDIWPDLVDETQYPRPFQRVDDFASGAAAMPDGSLWVSSFIRGLAHLDATGRVTARLTTADGLPTNKVFSLASDPGDGSLWVGTSYAGVSRLRNGSFTTYDHAVFGEDLMNQRIVDIQSWGTGATRRMVVSFGGSSVNAGAVGVYSGE